MNGTFFLKALVILLAIGQPGLAGAGYYLFGHVGGGRASDSTIDNVGAADHPEQPERRRPPD